MFTIIIQEKGGESRRMVFNKPEVTIGRVQGNDIVLPKGNVSKRHARIVLKDGKFIIVDLKSTNGTYVNGRKITSPLVVKDSDKIYIGDFIVGVDEAASGDGDGASETTTSPPGERLAASAPPAAPPMIDRAPPRPTEAQPAIQAPPDVAAPRRCRRCVRAAASRAGCRRASRCAPRDPARDARGRRCAIRCRRWRRRRAPRGSPRWHDAAAVDRARDSADGARAGRAAAHDDARRAGARADAGADAGADADRPAAPIARNPIRCRRRSCRRRRSTPATVRRRRPRARRALRWCRSPATKRRRGSSVPAPSASRVARCRCRAGAASRSSRSIPSSSRCSICSRTILERLRAKLDLDKIPMERLHEEELWQKAERATIDLVETLETSGELPKYIDQDTLIKETLNEALALGPLEDLFADEKIDEIIIDRRDRLVVGKDGHLRGSGKAFSSDDVFEKVVKRLVAEAGTTIDETRPLVDLRMRDGTRLTAAVSPIAARGACLVLKKPQAVMPTIADLLASSALSVAGMADFLANLRSRRAATSWCAVVRARARPRWWPRSRPRRPRASAWCRSKWSRS